MFELDGSRPEALWLLLLPLILLAASRLRARPAALATGTLDLWREVAASRESQGERRARRIPPHVLLLALGLAAGALALADPVRPQQPAARRHVCVVDASPSMYLPAGGGSRLARALERAEAILAERRAPGDTVEWRRTVDGVAESAPEVPASWLVAPEAPQPEPRWGDVDRPDTLWITDDARGLAPGAATVVASGGAAVPGPIATRGTTRFDWDGARVVEVPDGAPRGDVRFASGARARWAAELVELVEVWARERGLDLADGAGDARLTLAAGQGPERAVSAGRDGWRFDGAASVLSEQRPGESVWLADEEGDLVRAGAGRVACALARAEELTGDPAAFAVSWAELLDGALLPAAGVVTLDERGAAGEARVVAPRHEPPRESAVRAAGTPPAAWLASAAFVLAGLGLALGAFGSRGLSR